MARNGYRNPCRLASHLVRTERNLRLALARAQQSPQPALEWQCRRRSGSSDDDFTSGRWRVNAERPSRVLHVPTESNRRRSFVARKAETESYPPEAKSSDKSGCSRVCKPAGTARVKWSLTRS